MAYQLRVLGAAEVRDDHGDLVRAVVGHPKRLALLTVLAVEGAEQPVQRETLMGLLWPESSPSRARNALSQTLYHLRRALGSDTIVNRSGDSLWLSSTDLVSDVGAFTRLATEGSPAEAFELYDGDLLPGIHVPGAGAFERWLDGARSRLKTLHATVTEARIEELLAEEDAEAAATVARHACVVRPDSERNVRRLMQLLARAGDRLGALAAYDEFAARIHSEFESTPSVQTQDLAEAIRTETWSGARPSGGKGYEPASVTGAPSATRSRWRRRVASAVLVPLGMVGAFSLIARRPAAPANFEGTPRLAVMPFTVRGDADDDGLSESMVTLLSTRLDGVGGAHAIDPRSVLKHVDVEGPDGATAANALGASHYVLGDVVAAGEAIELAASVYTVDGLEPLFTARSTGDPGSLIELVDRLTGDLLAAGFLQPRSRTASLAARTTNDLEALKKYLEGDRLIREGQFSAALQVLQDAVALDTTFALAHYQLAIAANWADDPVTGRRAARDAFRFRDGLAPRTRTLVEALEPFSREEYWVADPLYRDIVARYPDQLEAWYMLAESVFHGGFSTGTPMVSSRPMFERILEHDSANAEALIHVIRLAAREGDLEAVDRYSERLAAPGVAPDRALEAKALSAFVREDEASKEAAIAALRDAPEVVVALAAIGVAVFGGDLEGARRITTLLIRRNAGNYLPWARLMEIQLALGQGRLTEARALVESNPNPVHRALGASRVASWAGVVGLPEGTGPELAEWAARLTEPQEEWPPELVRGLIDAGAGKADRIGDGVAALADRNATHAHALRAWQHWLEGDPEKTIEALLASRPHEYRGAPVFSPAQGERILYARALSDLGQHDLALAALVTIGDHTGYDVMLLAPAELEQARLYRLSGDESRAIHHYRRFLDYWADSDGALEPLKLEARGALGVQH